MSDVHSCAAGEEHTRKRRENACFAEEGGIVPVLEENAFYAPERRVVQKNAQPVDAFFEERVCLEGIPEACDGGVDVRDAHKFRSHAAVNDRFDGGSEEQIRSFFPENALQIKKSDHVAQGINALAVETVIDDAYAKLLDAFFRCGVTAGKQTEHGVPFRQHVLHQNAPEQIDGARLVAQNADFHNHVLYPHRALNVLAEPCMDLSPCVGTGSSLQKKCSSEKTEPLPGRPAGRAGPLQRRGCGL